MKLSMRSDFYQHAECKTMLMSEIKKLGGKRGWIKRYCELLHISYRDAKALIKGIRV